MAEFWQLKFPIPGQSETVARAAEEAGFDGLYFADTQCLSGDIYSAMCLAARATTRLKVGTAVTNPVTRHPAVTASAIATVQVESGGRAVLGIGRGDSSLAYLGQKPASWRTLENYVDQLQRYLRGEAVDLDGYASRNMWIQKSGQPKVPVDVAATGPRVISLGARLADRVTFAVGADVSRMRAALGAARSARESAGLDPAGISLGAYINVGCHPDVGQAREIVKGQVGSFAHFTGMSGENSRGLQDAETFRHIGANYDMANHGLAAGRHLQAVGDDFISRFAVTGSPSYCVDRLGELIELGLDRLVLLTGSRDGDQVRIAAGVERLGSEVLPQLRQKVGPTS